jgi:hypothetical protein
MTTPATASTSAGSNPSGEESTMTTTTVTTTAPPAGALGSGIYAGLTMDRYHRDPAPIPSASCSILELLLDKTPHHAWREHPRLNPDWQPSASSRKADLGTCVHEMATRRGRGLVTINADSFRTAAAQEARDAARAAGRTPILRGDRAKAAEILRSLRKRVRQHEDTRGAFRDGHGEVTMIAQLSRGVWGRALVDWVRTGPGGNTDRTLWDLKTTSADIGDAALQRRIGDDNLDLRAAWYLHLASTLFLEQPDQWRYVYVFVETTSPYEVRFAQLSEGQLEVGRQKVRTALDLWARCLLSGEWPGYPAGIETLEGSSWSRQQWEVRHLMELDARSAGTDPFTLRARGHKDRRGLRVPEFGSVNIFS